MTTLAAVAKMTLRQRVATVGKLGPRQVVCQFAKLVATRGKHVGRYKIINDNDLR
jgi:hypothetical protein